MNRPGNKKGLTPRCRFGNKGGMAHPLTAFRKAKKLSQAELGKQLGVSPAAVSRWEAGERFPDRELWPRIRAVTGLGVEDLNAGKAA